MMIEASFFPFFDNASYTGFFFFLHTFYTLRWQYRMGQHCPETMTVKVIL
jgi:hypothetical protein